MSAVSLRDKSVGFHSLQLFAASAKRTMLGIQAIVFFAFLSSCFAAKFAMFPMPFGRSHFLFVSKLGQELTERGHEVRLSNILYTRSFSVKVSAGVAWKLGAVTGIFF